MGILDGLFGGGGGESYSYGITSTIQGGDRAVTVDVGLDDVNLDMGLDDVNIDTGLDDVNIDVGGTGTPLATTTEVTFPLPITTNTDIDLAVTQPINTNSDISSKLDVEPVQVDLCIDVGLSKLPNARISQPYESHFGVTVLGAELVGFNWSGESNTIIDDLPNRPHVEPGGQPTRRHVTAPRRTFERSAAVKRGPDGGLHIRLN